MHMKRLKNIRVSLANFFASGVLHLGSKLRPFQWQYPPNFRFDLAVFESFLQLLPRDTEAAASVPQRIAKNGGSLSSKRL
jgi:uncharacterized protein YecE (DUF72 family)